MADHYFSVPPTKATQRTANSVTVGTSSAGSSKIELRVTDGACTAKEIADVTQWLSDLFGSTNRVIIPSGFLKR